MKVIIVSDSHSYTSNLEAVFEAENSFSAVIHLGDGASDMKYISRYTDGKPVYQLKGNCDYYGDSLKRFISFFDELKFFACHGDAYNVKTTLISLMYAAKEYECQLVLYGHTHRAHKEFFDGMCFFNPGSVANGEYGVLEVKGKSFEITHKNILGTSTR